MNIVISTTSGEPIYEQIAEQLRTQIISGALLPDQALPSMRLLAKELRVSLITTKRAYEELERDGYIHTVTGKGSFVSHLNNEKVYAEQLEAIRSLMQDAAARARLCGIPLSELTQLLTQIFKEESP